MFSIVVCFTGNLYNRTSQYTTVWIFRRCRGHSNQTTHGKGHRNTRCHIRVQNMFISQLCIWDGSSYSTKPLQSSQSSCSSKPSLRASAVKGLFGKKKVRQELFPAGQDKALTILHPCAFQWLTRSPTWSPTRNLMFPQVAATFII